MGRTGNGKSSLINALFGTSFNTDPLVACTKELHSVMLLEPRVEGKDAIMVMDTPGIGEFSSDDHYMTYYEYAASVADCIVLVLTFDRVDAPSQRLLKQMKALIGDRQVKFVVALNHIDSRVIATDSNYEAWDKEANRPTAACEENIQQRTEIIHQHFDKIIGDFEVIPVCAAKQYNYGIEKLREKIFNK